MVVLMAVLLTTTSIGLQTVVTGSAEESQLVFDGLNENKREFIRDGSFTQHEMGTSGQFRASTIGMVQGQTNDHYPGDNCEFGSARAMMEVHLLVDGANDDGNRLYHLEWIGVGCPTVHDWCTGTEEEDGVIRGECGSTRFVLEDLSISPTGMTSFHLTVYNSDYFVLIPLLPYYYRLSGSFQGAGVTIPS